MDYPRSDRHFSAALRRLTRIHARSVEQPVNLDDGDEVFYWPWLYGVEVGHWDLTDAQAAKLREYLLRGGFFMCDDFHGTYEWEVFTASMKRVFPDRPIVDIDNSDQIFHTLYDLDDRYQVPGAQYLRSRRSCTSTTASMPRWRGIYDDKGRLMVAICHNMDLGDSWEHADNPRVSGEVLRPRHPHRRELRRLRHDALSCTRPPRDCGTTLPVCQVLRRAGSGSRTDPSKNLCADLFRLLPREYHPALQCLVQVFGTPIWLHDPASRVSAPTQEQVAQFVGDDLAENRPIGPLTANDKHLKVVGVHIRECGEFTGISEQRASELTRLEV